MILFVLILEIISVSEQEVYEYRGWSMVSSNHAEKSDSAKISEILHLYGVKMIVNFI